MRPVDGVNPVADWFTSRGTLYGNANTVGRTATIGLGHTAQQAIYYAAVCYTSAHVVAGGIIFYP